MPFAVSEGKNSKFTVQNDQSASDVIEEAAPTNTTGGQAIASEELTFNNENLVTDEPIATGNNQKSNLISTEFLDTIQIKLPPISSEELEHVEDTGLDAAFDAKLTLEGDNLFPIKNAAKIVETY